MAYGKVNLLAEYLKEPIRYSYCKIAPPQPYHRHFKSKVANNGVVATNGVSTICITFK